MNAHLHDPAVGPDRDRIGPAVARALPWWVLPGLAVGLIAIGLVVAGVLPISTVIYAGLFGGMIFLHVGGHGGHGSHGSHGSHGGHEGGLSRDEDLSRGSGDSHRGQPGLADGLDDRASDDRTRDEMDDDDQHSSHACH